MNKDDIEFYHGGAVLALAYAYSGATGDEFSNLSYRTRQRYLDAAVIALSRMKPEDAKAISDAVTAIHCPPRRIYVTLPTYGNRVVGFSVPAGVSVAEVAREVARMKAAPSRQIVSLDGPPKDKIKWIKWVVKCALVRFKRQERINEEDYFNAIMDAYAPPNPGSTRDMPTMC